MIKDISYFFFKLNFCSCDAANENVSYYVSDSRAAIVLSLFTATWYWCHTGIVRQIDLNDVTGDSFKLIRPFCRWSCGKLAIIQ